MSARGVITALTITVYLTVVGLALAAVWTASGHDLSTNLGGTAVLLTVAAGIGALIGAGLSIFWEDHRS